MSEDKIIAVVVTYNRRALVPRALDGLRAQTRPLDGIILIDNASTDGTPEELRRRGLLDDPRIDYVRMATNVGGAGGFHEGMRRAFEAGADWVWVMDDDGCPSPAALMSLTKSRALALYGDRVVVGSLVVDFDDEGTLAFPVPNLSSGYIKCVDRYTRNTTRSADIVSYPDPCGYPWGMFFNASLFSRRTIAEIGLPIKDMFVWGDESEYFHRVRNAGNKTYIVSDSIFNHPTAKPSRAFRFKKMYAVRNMAFVHRRYKRFPALHHAASLMKIVRSGELYLIRALMHGMRGNLAAKYHEWRSLRRLA